MSTLLGSTSDPTYTTRWQGYSFDNQYALRLTLPAGGPWRIVTLGAWLAGDSTHFSKNPTVYLCAWDNSSGALLGSSAGFTPTARAYGNSDKYEKAVSSPFTVAGGTTIMVGFGWTPWSSGYGIQWDTSNATALGGPNHSVPGSFGTAYSDSGKLQAWLYYELANTAPNAPTLSSPADGAVITTATPTLQTAAHDVDGDALQFDVQVSTDSTFTSITHWNGVLVGSAASDATASIVYAGAALTRGQTYYWRTRAYDGTAYGAYSSSRSFKYNQLPVTTLTAPANASAQTTATPTLTASASDPDAGDTIASYDVQVSTDSTFVSVTHWNLAGQTTGLSGGSISRVYGGTAIARGTTVYWRMRTTDSRGEAGAWTAARSWTYHSLPTTSARTPAASALAYVTNLSDLALWNNTSAFAKPRLGFTYSQAEGRAMVSYQLRIYSASVGGSTLYDSGTVALALANGAATTVDVPYALVNGTEYWWTILTTDGIEAGSESARTAFKVRWAQGLYEHDTGIVTPTDLGFSNGTIVKYAAFAFRSATSSGGDAATGKSAWTASMAAVTPQEWLQVLVRLSTDAAGTGATVADMTVTYRGATGTPDTWHVL